MALRWNPITGEWEPEPEVVEPTPLPPGQVIDPTTNEPTQTTDPGEVVQPTPAIPTTPTPTVETPGEGAGTTTTTTPPAPSPPVAPATEPEHNVEYKPKYDAQGRIVAYEMWVDGKLQQTFDYTHLYEDLDAVEKPGTFQDWLTNTGYNYQPIQGTAEYGALTDLIALLEDPNTLDADKAKAEEQTARALGYGSVQEMIDDIERRRQMTEGGSNAMQGLSDAERSAFERSMANTRKKSEDTMRRTLDQVLSGATGNSTRNALIKANEYIGQIQDVEIQGNVQLAMMEAERRKEQFDQQFAMYKDLLDRGQATTEQVYNALYNNRMAAMQGYATQISAVMSQNQQYLDMYKADLDRIRLASDQVYASVQAELEIGSDMRDAIADSFAQYWAEIMAPLNYDTALQENEALRQQNTWGTVGRVFSVLGFIVGAALLFVNPAIGVGLMGASLTGMAS